MNSHSYSFKHLTTALLLAAAALLPGAATAEDPYTVEWKRQIGTSNYDESRSVAIDGSGNVYISGSTSGNLGGSSTYSRNVFLTKFSPAGAELWSQQIGTDAYDEGYSVAVDGAGNVYISGSTEGSLGGTNAGDSDAFLTKFDPAGAELWSQQIGTIDGDYSRSVAVDGSGNAFITGYTYDNLAGTNAGGSDSFLVKFDPSGAELWRKQIGTANSDFSASVAVDGAGNAYISGDTYGSLGGTNAGGGNDAFLVKFDPAGAELWSQQIGTSGSEYSYSVAIDGSGNAYITGRTTGSLGGTNAGDDDAFLVKFDPGGAELWSQQIGTGELDFGYSVAIDGSGNAYISGFTGGSLGGANAGDRDAFLTKFDPGGAELWRQQVGSDAFDISYSVAIDGSGNAYISGITEGSLGETHAGSYDAFLIKFAPPVPEPTTVGLLSWATVGLALRRRRLR